jgi:hypothetical protein
MENIFNTFVSNFVDNIFNDIKTQIRISNKYKYEINNPNNIHINGSIENIEVIPIGFRCSTAIACMYSNLRNYSLPFDWVTHALPYKINQVFEKDFVNFLPTDLSIDKRHNTNIYNIALAHFSQMCNKDKNKGIIIMNRRIERLKKILTNNKVKYFIYINENHIPERYRNVKLDKNLSNKTFNEIIELDNFFKKHYSHCKCIIIYIDFFSHNVPIDSNIIHIMIHLNNSKTSSPLNRPFYGAILSDLFKSEYTLLKHRPW